MSFDFGAFAAAFASDPVLALIVILTLGATVVNGATDAPNAIATVVGTKAMKPTPAIAMAAVCNFVGLAAITMISSAVAATIFKMVDFGGDNHAALIALAAAMVAIIVWGVTAWYFGIPTSQSHSLIAGITGAAIALQGGLAGVNGAEWMKVVYGLVISTVLGFGTGWLFTRMIKRLCRGADRVKANSFFKWAQIVSGAGVAVLHGAQDGQKFLSLCMLGIMLAMTGQSGGDVTFPFWLIILVSATMALGTAVGGRKIIKSVGMDMVKMEQYQGFAACLSACFCIGLATFTGLPVSTTHTKTTAIMGVGAEKSLRNVKWGLAGRMVGTWVLTFPGCGLLAFAFTHLFLTFF
ncbi:inorganic phosphate transporter [Gordonibacter sp. 28C]|uniref:inorganic phosphate transporter n=1 Tax=Gordonibacter sp. 28C TaxID=2078569 RepID=UPI000DF7FB75|nr:inorganic phosphate transporter [Gordonibacter sp. 28C]RDB61564.1 inorganic phosphate transporter [Gordonibacter sp. 28C]